MADQASQDNQTQTQDPAVGDSGQSNATPQSQTGMAMSHNVDQVNREFQESSTLKKAKDMGLPYIDIAKTPLNPDFLKLLTIEEAREGRMIPFFKVGKKLRVTLEDPNAIKTQELIKKLQEQGYEIIINLSSPAGIEDALKIFDQTQKYQDIDLVDTVDQQSIQTYEKEIAGLAEVAKKLETVTAGQGLNLIDVGALKTGASDVHYEPGPTNVILRFRIDGVLHKVMDIKPAIYQNLINQIKYESKMKLNVNAVPQDGRYSFMFNKLSVGVRVSSIPTPYGESFVCRYLVSDEKPKSIEDLGFQGLALTKLSKVCGISHGMVLSTGPTGSGKTSTLYSILNQMNSPENKIITLEDPVEYTIDGVTQSQINEAQGYTFAGGLRTVLRQDPDVVMLGEIRDLETAETAAQAALTGHVVLSTLHTNSAIETIPRLANMGLPPFMIGPALNTIIAQRLVRKVCAGCVQMVDLEDCEKKEFECMIKTLDAVNKAAVIEMPTKIPKVGGCDKCSDTGYKGRLVIAEVVTINSTIRDLILKQASTVDLIAAARKEGIITIREDGFMKVAQGLTTMEEVYRVTNVIG
jgi:type IV pilus assembly protein PilB